MSLQLERFCDLLSADDFRAIAQAFPGAQRIYIPEGRGRTLEKFRGAIGKEKTALLIENWGGMLLCIPSAYLRSPLATPEALYTALFDNDKPISEVATEYQIHPWQLFLVLREEVIRRRDREICEKLDTCESTAELSARTGTPPGQIRVIAHKKRKFFEQALPRQEQLLLFDHG
jgi:hypothetical protein